MHTKTQNLINYFQDNGGVARFSGILKAGFHSDSLTVLEKNGKVEKISRGLYRLLCKRPTVLFVFFLPFRFTK
jgi:5-bromo-4-chloroindolyl phosphate hydrolysis protein